RLGAELAAQFVSPLMAADDLGSLAGYYRDLTIDRAAGVVRFQGEPLFAPGPAALSLQIGHHHPLADYIAGRKAQALGRRALADLRARVERSTALARALSEIDRAVIAQFEIEPA
ncbi:MAG TPA: hypothetical protein VGI70_05295, partial [Polyangiales bacterium]